MRFLFILSDLMVPLIFVGIITYGYMRRVEVYDTFVEGAKEGWGTILHIMPTLIGLMVAVGVIRASGALDLFSQFILPLCDRIGYPAQIVPLTFMRLISASASTGLVLDLFKQYGPDSFVGRLVSVMMGCTETVFYTMAVYFMAVNIKKTRYTLVGALLANFAGIIASIYVTLWIFGRG